jgi:hypothetical protein
MPPSTEPDQSQPVLDGRSLRQWASDRGLAYVVEQLLPPLTPRLREGLGMGPLRSDFDVPRFGGALVSTGIRTRPERQSTNVCSGRLPGGLDGTLAHHVHVGAWSTTSETVGRYWPAMRATIVVAQLPQRSRVASGLTVGRPAPPRALAEVSIRPRDRSDPARTIAPHPTTRVVRGGLLWRFATEEDDATVDAIAGVAQLAALAAAPDDTRVEFEHGALCVWTPGLIDDADQLDALCRAAAAIAEGVRAAVSAFPPLTADVAVAPPRSNARSGWIDAGVATVAWPQAPASVAEAVAAYEPVVAARASRLGRGWIAILLAAWLLGAAAVVGIALAWSEPLLLAGALVIVVAGAWRLPRILGREHRRFSADEVAARARSWGLEAFVRGYAHERGLALEDHDELRRRFDAPFAGFPQRAVHGDLGGVPGHLVMWVEPCEPPPHRRRLLALVPRPQRLEPPPAPYSAELRGEICIVAVEVADERSMAAALDALAAVACRVAAG